MLVSLLPFASDVDLSSHFVSDATISYIARTTDFQQEPLVPNLSL